MKFAGDVPKQHKELAKELEVLERIVDLGKQSNGKRAQAYTCLAHDWYQMNVEEEGHRLLLKADKVFPGYFESSLIKSQVEDEKFRIILNNVKIELTKMLLPNSDL